MTKKENFFSSKEEIQIINAIKAAENMTSGEIRVHISEKADKDSMVATQKIFHELRMFNTRERNGVLIHLSISSKSFSIFGDEGINKVVGQEFWDSTKDIMQNHFCKGDLTGGICEGINSVGEKLRDFFPYKKDDIDELPNEVSYD